MEEGSPAGSDNLGAAHPNATVASRLVDCTGVVDSQTNSLRQVATDKRRTAHISAANDAETFEIPTADIGGGLSAADTSHDITVAWNSGGGLAASCETSSPCRKNDELSMNELTLQLCWWTTATILSWWIPEMTAWGVAFDGYAFSTHLEIHAATSSATRSVGCVVDLQITNKSWVVSGSLLKTSMAAHYKCKLGNICCNRGLRNNARVTHGFMRVVLGSNKTCVVVPDAFRLACNVKTPVETILKAAPVSAVVNTLRAWDIHTSDAWSNCTSFAWWDAATIAVRCNNMELITALQSYVVDRHLTDEYNIRIVWTRMQYLSIGHNSYARHEPPAFTQVDELTPIINSAELADFGRVVAERFRMRLQTKCTGQRAIRAVRVNINPVDLSCVTFTAGDKSYVCVGPPHNDCDAALELLKRNVDINKGPPEWLVDRVTTAWERLDTLERKLDYALGLQQQMRASANCIYTRLRQFTASAANVKENVVSMLMDNLTQQSKRIAALQDQVNAQEEDAIRIQETMDWFVRETEEIKLFITWKQNCILIENALDGGDTPHPTP